MIPLDKFGESHWSTLLYLESRVVDHDGVPQQEHMRCDPRRHPWHAHRGSFGGLAPTRVRSASPDLTHDEVRDHDDWDCVEDLVAAGLLVNRGTRTRTVVGLTDEGWRVAGLLRRWRAEGKDLGEFEVPKDRVLVMREECALVIETAASSIPNAAVRERLAGFIRKMEVK